MAALQAHAQVYPTVAGLETIFAAFRGRFDCFDVVLRVSTCWFCHDDLFSLFGLPHAQSRWLSSSGLKPIATYGMKGRANSQAEKISSLRLIPDPGLYGSPGRWEANDSRSGAKNIIRTGDGSFATSERSRSRLVFNRWDEVPSEDAITQRVSAGHPLEISSDDTDA